MRKSATRLLGQINLLKINITLVPRSGFCSAPATRPPVTQPPLHNQPVPATKIPPFFTPPSPADNGLDLLDKPKDGIDPLSIPTTGGFGFDCPEGYTKFCCDSKVNPNSGRALGCEHCTLSFFHYLNRLFYFLARGKTCVALSLEAGNILRAYK